MHKTSIGLFFTKVTEHLPLKLNIPSLSHFLPFMETFHFIPISLCQQSWSYISREEIAVENWKKKRPFSLTMKAKSVILKYMLPPFLLSLEIQRMRRSGTKGPFSPSEMALRDMSPLHPHINTYSMYCKTLYLLNNTTTLFFDVQELCLFHFFI